MKLTGKIISGKSRGRELGIPTINLDIQTDALEHGVYAVRTEIGDRHEAIEQAVALMGTGDTLVVAGKGHEEGQIKAGVTLPFSDHAVLRDALGQQT